VRTTFTLLINAYFVNTAPTTIPLLAIAMFAAIQTKWPPATPPVPPLASPAQALTLQTPETLPTAETPPTVATMEPRSLYYSTHSS